MPERSRVVAFEATRPGLRERVSGAVEHDGAVVVQGVPVESDDALLDIVALVGTPSRAGNGGGLIYDVTPQLDGTDLSRTAARFPLHTDSTFLPEPHAYIALGCVEAPGAARGGESLALAAGALREAVARRRGTDVVAALSEPAYPFVIREPDGEEDVRPMAIFADEPGGCCGVRYRLDAIVRALQASGLVLAPRHSAALAALENVLSGPGLHASFALAPGDVLIVDNRHALHGRTAIDDGAERLLRRVKLDAR